MNSGNKKPSTLLNYSKKFAAFSAVLMTTVFNLPFLHISVASLYCNAQDSIHVGFECYSGIFLVHFAFGIILALLTLFFVAISMAFFIEMNPFSKLPFSSPRSNMPIIKLLLKLFFVLLFTIDYLGNLNQQSTAVAGVYLLFVVSSRAGDLPFFDRSVNRFTIICEGVLFWAAGVANIHAVKKKLRE